MKNPNPNVKPNPPKTVNPPHTILFFSQGFFSSLENSRISSSCGKKIINSENPFTPNIYPRVKKGQREGKRRFISFF